MQVAVPSFLLTVFSVLVVTDLCKITQLQTVIFCLKAGTQGSLFNVLGFCDLSLTSSWAALLPAVED